MIDLLIHLFFKKRVRLVNLGRYTDAVLTRNKAEQIVTQKQSKKEEDFWAESEWTIGKIPKRLFGYGMTALFIFIGVVFL
ncbi:MAG: hypothetical protein AAFO03_06675 [Bacteroidota bacterium]